MNNGGILSLSKTRMRRTQSFISLPDRRSHSCNSAFLSHNVLFQSHFDRKLSPLLQFLLLFGLFISFRMFFQHFFNLWITSIVIRFATVIVCFQGISSSLQKKVSYLVQSPTQSKNGRSLADFRHFPKYYFVWIERAQELGTFVLGTYPRLLNGSKTLVVAFARK